MRDLGEDVRNPLSEYFASYLKIKKLKGQREASTDENRKGCMATARLPRAPCAPARLSTRRCDAWKSSLCAPAGALSACFRLRGLPAQAQRSSRALRCAACSRADFQLILLNRDKAGDERGGRRACEAPQECGGRGKSPPPDTASTG